jgi:hypothetical protein
MKFSTKILVFTLIVASSHAFGAPNGIVEADYCQKNPANCSITFKGQVEIPDGQNVADLHLDQYEVAMEYFVYSIGPSISVKADVNSNGEYEFKSAPLLDDKGKPLDGEILVMLRIYHKASIKEVEGSATVLGHGLPSAFGFKRIALNGCAKRDDGLVHEFPQHGFCPAPHPPRDAASLPRNLTQPIGEDPNPCIDLKANVPQFCIMRADRFHVEDPFIKHRSCGITESALIIVDIDDHTVRKTVQPISQETMSALRRTFFSANGIPVPPLSRQRLVNHWKVINPASNTLADRVLLRTQHFNGGQWQIDAQDSSPDSQALIGLLDSICPPTENQ